jgi:hypothetical protein
MRHSFAVVGLVVALVTVATVVSLATPSPAQADICHSGPLSFGGVLNPAGDVCNVVGHPIRTAGHIGHAITHPGDIIAAPFKAAGDAVMSGVTKWVASGASWLVGQAGKLIDATTTPRLQSGWFGRQYDAMVKLAAVFALPLLLLAVMQAVLRRDGQILVRAVAVQLPLAFLLTAMAVVVSTLLLAITDQASSQVASSVGNDAQAFFADVGKSLLAITAATGNAVVPLFAVFPGGWSRRSPRSSCGSSCCCAPRRCTSACCSCR